MTRRKNRHPKRLADLPVSVQEGLCVHEALRRLGFTAGEIHAGFARTANPPGGRVFERGPRAGQSIPDNCKAVLIVLRTQGREFIVDYPEPDLTQRQFARLWEKGGRLWNRSTEDEANALWGQSWALTNALGLVTSLLDKGFFFPIAPSVSDPEFAMSLFAPPPAEA